MLVNGKSYRTIWTESEEKGLVVKIIDQRKLPHEFVIEELNSVDDAFRAIKEFYVRGAGLIGATAGYGMYLAVKEAAKQTPERFDSYLMKYVDKLKSARPTAANLENAVEMQLEKIARGKSISQKVSISLHTAQEIANDDAHGCRKGGEFGLELIEKIYSKKENKDEPVNVMTHCNAGALAFVDIGSATGPIYKAHEKGIPIHVWVSETRPWNQGRLTEWELTQQGVDNTVVTDNMTGALMLDEKVDLVITGADRVTYTGWVANKIGTRQKAVLAKYHNIPFYVAFPYLTLDWKTEHGKDIPIEEKSPDEIRFAEGYDENGKLAKVKVFSDNAKIYNPIFDITEPELITGFITERGICRPNKESIYGLFPEKQGFELNP